jgi:dTDP-4-dehydrorhamnose reductase
VIIPDVEIHGIASSEYPTRARRPLNSRLSLKKIETVFGLSPRPWQEALQECLERIGFV